MERFGVVIQTDSGNYYAYNMATNQIISIDRSWYKTISGLGNDERVFKELSDYGIVIEGVPDIIEWELSDKAYLKTIDEAIPALILELTQECTLRCEYCVYSGNYEKIRTHSKKHMSYDVIKDSLEYYAEHSKALNAANISFYGGEALMRFDEIKFAVEYARKLFFNKQLYFRISSNGTTLTDQIIHWLDQNKDVCVTVTVNGFAHDKYRKFASGEGSLNVITANLVKIKNNYPDLWKRVDFIANVATLQELLDLRRYYLKYIEKPPLLITGILEYGGNDKIREIVKAQDSSDVVNEVQTLLFDNLDDYILPYYKNELIDINTRDIGQRSNRCIETASCMPFTSSLFVSADGEFGVCERAGECNQLGNLSQGINTEFVSKLIMEMSKIINNQCRTCWCQRLCSMCIKDFAISKEGEISFDEEICFDISNNIKSSLKLFCEIAEHNPDALDKI
ncbi:MAG: radical SAM protein [Lachnospiraceae bacterium]|nr:radical SAM protein [Lachnospiraceae bacterium]